MRSLLVARVREGRCTERAKVKKVVLQLVFGVIVFPAMLTGSLYYLNSIGFFNLTAVEVSVENLPVGQEQFLEPLVTDLKSSLEKYKNVSLWKLPLKRISSEVASENWIMNLNVKRSWPTTLSVRIQPHEVKLLLMSKGGKLTPIIKEGQMLNPVDSRQAPDVALVEGDAFEKNPELRKKAVAVIEQIPDVGPFSKKTIAEIRHNKNEGFWMTLVKSGITVKMGEEQVALKASRVSQVVEYLENRQFEARVIDANLSKKVLVRLRKGP